MNIFILDNEPIRAAFRLSVKNKYLVKMPIEYCQMMTTACYRNGWTVPLKKDGTLYKKSYEHHPCTKWVCESTQNFVWLFQNTKIILQLYEKTYEKIHGSVFCFDQLMKIALLDDKIDDSLWKHHTDFVNCTPYKEMPTVDAYRKYFEIDKAHIR